MKSKRFIFIIVFSLIGLVALLTGVFLLTRNDDKVFTKSGYVLNNLASGNGDRVYFDEGTEYKEKYPESIIFEDSDKKEKTITTDHFLHYLDGSITYLRNGVLLDLSTINNSLVSYYNITDKISIEYNDGAYYIEQLSDTLHFDNFVGKINENKYIVAGEDVALQMSGAKTRTGADYFELEFIEGDIVVISNQEVSYQTVSSNTFIYVGEDIVINLGDKTIYYKDEPKMTLSQIVIDDEDNIDIIAKDPVIDDSEEDEDKVEVNRNPGEIDVPEEEAYITNNTDNNEQTNNVTNNNETVTNNNENVTNNTVTDNNTENNNPGGSTGGNTGGTGGGSAGGTGGGGLSISKEPKIALTDASVTANSLSAKISITDNENMLEGDLVLTIVNTSTGTTVFRNSYSSDVGNIDVSVDNLTPDSNHVITITGNYTENEVTYEKQFFNKMLKTDSLGLSMKKNYSASDTLSFVVSKNDDSLVNLVKVRLRNAKGEVIATKTVDFSLKNTMEVDFEDLKSNTTYRAVLEDVMYNGVSLVNQSTISVTASTLKQKPTFGETSFVINKKAYSFNLRLEDYDDPDDGIVAYKYVVYKNEDIGTENEQPIMIIEKEAGSTADLVVDGTKIVRSGEYVFKVIVDFNDNEKVIEYESELSDVMSMDSVTFPTITWESSEITFEHIKGNILIHDEHGALNKKENLRITYVDSVGTHGEIKNVQVNPDTNSIMVDIESLRANETYIISLYGDIDLKDENDVLTNHLVGSVVVKTDKIVPITVLSWEEEEGYNMLLPFTVRTRFGSSKGSDLEASVLGSITYNLYKGKTVNSQEFVTKITKENVNLSSFHNSSLKTDFFDNAYDITPSFFDLSNERLKELSGGTLYRNYTIEITDAYDYSGLNKIPIDNGVYTVTTNEELPDYEEDVVTDLLVTEIKNGETFADLKSGTIIGYNLKPVYEISDIYKVTVNYYVYDVTSGEEVLILEKNVEVDDYATYEGETFELGYGTAIDVVDETLVRGHIYRFKFNLTVDDGNNVVYWPSEDTKIQAKGDYTAAKEEPTVLLYPHESNGNSITYMYKLKDPDFALSNPLTGETDYTNKLYHAVLGANKTPQEISVSDEFRPITFDSMKYNDQYYIRYKQTLLKHESQYNFYNKIVNIDTSKFEGLFSTSGMNLNYFLGESPQANTVLISLHDYTANHKFYNRVTDYKLVFTTEDDEIVKEHVMVEHVGGGEYGFIVDYSDLITMKDKEINVDVYAYYDTGLIGYNVPSDFGYAFQTNGGYRAFGVYLQLDAEGNIYEGENALASRFNYTINHKTNRLELESLISGGTKSVKFSHSSFGLLSEEKYFSPKQLNELKLSGEDTTFSFDKLIPGVAFTEMSPTLRGIDLQMNVYGLDKTILQEENYYILIYDEFANLIKTEVVPIDAIEDTIKIRGLMPNSRYFFTVNIKMVGEEDLVMLYDNVTQTYKNYNFITTNTVLISDVTLTYSAESYDDKSLVIAYTLGVTEGYDEIRYGLYYLDENEEKVYLDVAPDTELLNTMDNVIEIKPGFVFGKTYYLDIIPVMYYEENGETKEYTSFEKSSHSIEIPTLRSPNFVVRKNATVEEGVYGLDFTVVGLDEDKTIVNGTYYVELHDKEGNLVSKDDCDGEGCQISVEEKTFKFVGLKPSEKYVFYIVTKIDKNYVGASNITEFERIPYNMMTTGEYGVSFGEMTVKDKDNSVYLLFTDSSGLVGSGITLHYTFYGNLNSQNQYSGSINLDDEGIMESILQRVPFGNYSYDYYYYKMSIPEVLNADQYTIQLQFRMDDKTIYEDTVNNYVID